MKTCAKCQITKEDSDFTIRNYKDGRIGLRSKCKPCSQTERDEWRAKSSKDNDRNKAYNKEHAEEIRGKKLVKNYWPNLTWQEALAEWSSLYQKQGGKCAFGHVVAKLHVDHCHTTGKIRGLLCYNCNNGLGRLKDDIMVLEMAIVYLKKSRE